MAMDPVDQLHTDLGFAAVEPQLRAVSGVWETLVGSMPTHRESARPLVRQGVAHSLASFRSKSFAYDRCEF